MTTKSAHLTFRTSKDKYELEKYLVATPITKHRISLTRLRINDHSLQIDKERHSRPYIKAEERICLICKKDVEDEKHFIANCETYKELRKSFVYKTTLQNVSENKIFHLAINPPAKLAGVAARYIHDCLQRRNVMLSNLT